METVQLCVNCYYCHQFSLLVLRPHLLFACCLFGCSLPLCQCQCLKFSAGASFAFHLTLNFIDESWAGSSSSFNIMKTLTLLLLVKVIYQRDCFPQDPTLGAKMQFWKYLAPPVPWHNKGHLTQALGISSNREKKEGGHSCGIINVTNSSIKCPQPFFSPISNSKGRKS